MMVFSRRAKRIIITLASILLCIVVVVSLLPALLDISSDESFILIHDKLHRTYSKFDELVTPKRTSKVGEQTVVSTKNSYKAHGFTMLDRLYMKNGTLFIVTNDPSEFPSRPHIISRPVDIGAGLDMTPTDQELQFITPEESQLILGEHAVRVDGLSFIVSDNNQFVNHYYHLWGEIILGAWRIYSSLRSSTRSRHLPFPDRIILPHIAARSWRDPARVNGALLRAAFPSSSLLASDYWGDLIELGQPIVFERALIINREAAHGDPLYQNLYKMIAGTWGVEAPADFWEPIRQSAVENAVGYLPLLDSRGVVVSPDSKKTTLPVVVYVSRQRASSRRLTQNDHYLLVQSLAKLAEEGVCEFQAVEMEGMSLKEQIELVARATIIVGVHGNGLTHQLWMPRSSRSTVVEIFAPGSYTFDYEFLARNMGHRHYAVWNDTLLTYPAGSRHERVFFGDDFHAANIPVYGLIVAHMIRERLSN